MMKKFISLLCVLSLMLGALAFSSVSASAAVDAAKTMVDVKTGDEVTYVLNLGGVATPIIGCDFSIYYDSSLFEFVSVADFNDKTSEEEWTPLINPNLDGQIAGNWSILKGVDFKTERHFLTVKLKAKKAGTGEISYFIYYMYDNNVFNEGKPQITEYKFTCDVSVNGSAVLEDAEPQLNTDDKPKKGLFVNSVTGDSDDADESVPGAVANKVTAGNSGSAAGNNNANNNAGNNGSANGNAGSNAGAGANANVNSGAANAAANGNSGANTSSNTSSAAASATATEQEFATTAEGYYVVATDAEGNVTATSDQPPVIDGNGSKKGGGKAILWIVLALVVLAGGGAAVFFYLKKKPAAAGSDAAVTQPIADSDKTVLADNGDEKTEIIDK